MNLLLLLVLVCVVAQLKNCPYVPSVLKKNKQNLCWVAVILLVLCMTGMIEGMNDGVDLPSWRDAGSKPSSDPGISSRHDKGKYFDYDKGKIFNYDKGKKFNYDKGKDFQYDTVDNRIYRK